VRPAGSARSWVRPPQPRNLFCRFIEVHQFRPGLRHVRSACGSDRSGGWWDRHVSFMGPVCQVGGGTWLSDVLTRSAWLTGPVGTACGALWDPLSGLLMGPTGQVVGCIDTSALWDLSMGPARSARSVYGICHIGEMLTCQSSHSVLY
jgi:hypothetical protein